MEIQTARFGRIDVQPEKIITFPRGLLGFPGSNEFILFPHKEGSPFFWLQSVTDGTLAFVVMNPTLVLADYHVDVDNGVLRDLGGEEAGDLDVVCMVTVPADDPRKMTINLLGPVVLATASRRAVQLISTSSEYSHRHPVMMQEK